MYGVKAMTNILVTLHIPAATATCHSLPRKTGTKPSSRPGEPHLTLPLTNTANTKTLHATAHSLRPHRSSQGGELLGQNRMLVRKLCVSCTKQPCCLYGNAAACQHSKPQGCRVLLIRCFCE